MRPYFPSASNQQLPTEEANQHLNQPVPSHYILLFACSIYGVTNKASKQGRKKKKKKLYKQAFSSSNKTAHIFISSSLHIPNPLIPYKPSNSLILFHLQSMHLYHATLRYPEHTPCLFLSIITDPLHPNLDFLL